jgi:hypothetical protein
MNLVKNSKKTKTNQQNPSHLTDSSVLRKWIIVLKEKKMFLYKHFYEILLILYI